MWGERGMSSVVVSDWLFERAKALKSRANPGWRGFLCSKVSVQVQGVMPGLLVGQKLGALP